jgi:hypothetical protein
VAGLPPLPPHAASATLNDTAAAVVRKSRRFTKARKDLDMGELPSKGGTGTRADRVRGQVWVLEEKRGVEVTIRAS